MDRARRALKENSAQQALWRETLQMMGRDPNESFEPSEDLVRNAAIRMAAEEERAQVRADLDVSRGDISTLWRQYECAEPGTERQHLEVKLIPLLKGRNEGLRASFGVQGGISRCGPPCSQAEELYYDMVALEAVAVACGGRR
jgi:hypothetical protein